MVDSWTASGDFSTTGGAGGGATGATGFATAATGAAGAAAAGTAGVVVAGGAGVAIFSRELIGTTWARITGRAGPEAGCAAGFAGGVSTARDASCADWNGNSR